MTNRQTSLLLVLLGFATLGLACKKTQPVTEIVLEIGTNLPVPSEMDGLSLTVSTEVYPKFFNKAYSLGTGPGQIMLPRRMTLTPSVPGTTITVSVDGLLGTTVVVSRMAITSFVQGQSRLLRIDLLKECVGTLACPSNQTCLAAATCADANIDPSTLPVFDPKQSPQPAPLYRDAGAPSDGARDGPSADALPDAGRDLGADGRSTTDVSALDVPATKSNGAACTSAAECQAGFCVDGVCCASECKDVCHSCNLTGQAGRCAPAAPGSDPRDNCAKDDERTCNKTGACDGKGACQLYPAGTECFPQACSGFSRATASRCDGLGACVRGPVLSCAPNLCNDQSPTGECLATCTGSAQCFSPAVCQAGSCGKKALGAACALAADCNSGFCADGVCCQSACTDSCRSCAVAGSLGACIAAPADKSDPKNQCKVDPTAPCGNDATCDGAGRCRVATAGTPCADATCAGPVAVAPKFCDGLGSCLAASQQSCEPYACSAATCQSFCASNGDCAPGAFCVSGACIGRKGIGATCQSGGDCSSGFCADGVCCDSDCSSACASCNQPGRAGTCSPLASGGQPKNNGCPKEDASTCGKDGTCDGAGACRLYGSDTVCKDPSCTDASKTLASTCNGSGACLAHGSQTCAPFQCGSKDCLATCGSDTDCVAPAPCTAGSCGKKAAGAACQTATDCQSGVCAQGVCCSGPCDGACQSCAIPGTEGTCKPVPVGLPDPKGTCPKAASPATCGLDGTCDGSGACHFYQGNTCGSASCKAGSLVQAGTCSGRGDCQAPPVRACAPYACDTATAACKTSCASDVDCDTSAYCSGTTCTSRKDNVGACTLAKECISGFCVDGFCCNGACSGSCMSCRVPGSVGTCSPIPLNNPAEGDCPDDGAQTCARNGKCNGAGGCMLYPSGSTCSAETCPAGSATHTRPGLCDGQGHCGAGQVQPCTPYLCNAATGTCYSGCSTGGSECQPPNLCANGSCGKKGNGQACSSPSECASNFCEQGVCCGGACQGLCMSCAVSGSLGSCSAVRSGQADPQGRCLDQGVATCGTNGWCDGGGACQKYAAGLQCQVTCDSTGTTFTTFTCNGSGVCALSNTQACTPYKCDASGCKKSCVNPSDCAPGFGCSPSATCVRPPEDCMNGVDDDGNGLIDCADPACTAGFMCVPQVPSGFTGPVEVYDGPNNIVICDPLYTTDYFMGYATPQCDFSCSPCACGTPAGVTCGSPGFSYTTDMLTLCPRPQPVPFGLCNNNVDTKIVKFATSAGAAGGGNCVTGGGAANLSPISWNTGHFCGAEAKGGQGCDKGYVCWPRPQQPFLRQACVFGNGDLTCPSTGGYPVKRSYYDTQDVKDLRRCASTCGCGSPSGVSCNARLDWWGLTPIPCAGHSVSSPVPSLCQSAPQGMVSAMFTDLGFSGGSCPTTGSATPAGGCTPMGKPTTACCTQ
jgi:hypothetical protein